MFDSIKRASILGGLMACLLTPTSAFAAEGSYDPATGQSATLRMSVLPGGAKPTGVKLRLTEIRGGETRTQEIIAILIGLLTTPKVSLTGHPAIPANVASLPNGRLGAEVSLEPLLNALAADGWTVTNIVASDPPPVIASPAEGTWVGIGPFGWWECALEDSDVSWCNGLCGGEANVSSLESEPSTPSNNPFFEPSCDTTCECTDGHGPGGTQTDPPATVTVDG